MGWGVGRHFSFSGILLVEANCFAVLFDSWASRPNEIIARVQGVEIRRNSNGGAVVLLYALFGDWVRQHVWAGVNRGRYPKCWYDLSHTEGLRCSGCGYLGTNERKLHKARRSRRWFAFAVLVFDAAYVSVALPCVLKRGWVGWVRHRGICF